MTGIAAIICKAGRTNTPAALDAMLQSMNWGASRSCDSYANERLGLQSGWIFSGNVISDQVAIWNETRDICLIFAGEEFSERSQIDQLRARGHTFSADGPDYLVHWYEEAGLKFLEQLNGWFCGLIIDLRENKVVLFNDRYGISRVHYHETEDAFYLASEAKALLKVLPQLRKFDLNSLGEFYSCGCVLQNRTLFANVSLLPPGSAWTFAPDGSVSKRSYFTCATWENQSKLSAPDYYEQLKATWQRLLPRYFRGGKVALSLTGGVDSRMILAWAPHLAEDLVCYTFGGRYRDCADVRISRQIARICGQSHHVIPVDGEFLSGFPELAEQTVYRSDGTMDVTGSIDLYIQRAARSIAPIRVTGTNGGEILRSLAAFKPMRLSQDLFNPEFQPAFREAAQTYAKELNGHRLSFTAFKQAPWYMGSKFIIERSEVNLRMPYFDNDLVSLVYQAPPEYVDDNGLSLRLTADGNPALANVGTDRGVALSPVPGITRARNLFQEFTFKAEYAYDYGMPQWLARIDHALSPLKLERLFLGRHKFHHFRSFYRDELASYLKDVLLSPAARSRSYLNGNVLQEMVNGHTKGNRNYTLELHKVLTTELIHRQFFDRN